MNTTRRSPAGVLLAAEVEILRRSLSDRLRMTSVLVLAATKVAPQLCWETTT